MRLPDPFSPRAPEILNRVASGINGMLSVSGGQVPFLMENVTCADFSLFTRILHFEN